MSTIRGVQLREPTGSYATTGSNTFTGKQSISGSIVLLNNYGGIYTTTVAGAEVQSFYIDQGNNLIYRATSSGDHYFYDGNNAIARFVNGGTINLGGTSATSNPRVKIPSAGGMIITGSVYVSGSLYMNNNKQFNYGAFSSTQTQTLAAGVSGSMTFNTIDVVDGVAVINDSRLVVPNTGIYNIQFSAQLDYYLGADDVYIWLKKNGINVDNSATVLSLSNNHKAVAAWNWVYPLVTGDYIEIAWQTSLGNSRILANTSPGVNVPAIPSVIVTVTQVA